MRCARSGGFGRGRLMTPFDVGLASFGVMVVLVYAGLWVPFALMLCSYAGVWLIKGSPVLAGKLLALAAADTISSYFFGVVPLFVLMGFIVSASGMGRDAFDVANALFRRLSGGLGIGTVGANAIFAAITGISIASAAIFTRIAVPEMMRHGYSARAASGIVAGSSVLGMLIPPSLLLILYGLLTEQSVGDLFIAGVLPGIILALFFAGAIWSAARFRPQWLGPAVRDGGDIPPLSGTDMLRKGGPIALLIGLVLGGIYGGLFTPIEAGAVGCLSAFVIALVRRSMGLRDYWQVLTDTGLVTAAISFLIIAAQMYSRMLALSGVPAGMGSFITSAEIGYWGVILGYVALVIVMGTILDSSSIMLILVPLVLPVITAMQVDLVWFGIVTIIAVEIGLLTPPFGISVFVIKSALNDPAVPLGEIFRGAAPFAGLMLLVLILVLIFPWLATGLL